MFKLLNRFAWFLSFIIGFVISLSVIGFSAYRGIGGEEIIMSLFWGIIVGLIIKQILFSSNFINSRLEFFVKQSFNLKDEKIINKAKKIKKEEKIEKIKEVDLIKTDFKKNKKHNKKKKIHLEEKEYYGSNDKESIVIKYIKEFFAENLLAKIGSILVFLGVLFLMSLIWNQIPSVLKIIIGFIIGFGVYFVGVWLNKKGNTGESRILLGTGILINFLVILAGRYLIGDNYGTSGVLGDGITFVFLILNTIFGVLTSFVYKSRTILIFAFIFAYLNPFLVGGSFDTPYLLVGYSMIVSLGALLIGIKQNDNVLKLSSFILGNALFLLAPFNSEIGWIIKLFASGILGFITILSLFKIDPKNSKISFVFILNYIFIILLLFNGGDSGILGAGVSYISYMISILLFFSIGIFLILYSAIESIISLFVFPILIILGLIFLGGNIFIIPSLVIVVVSYLIGFTFLSSLLSNSIKYLFFILLIIFIFSVNCFISFNYSYNIDLSFSSFLTTIIVSFVFFFTSYLFSRKEGLEYLYTIGTIGTIAILLPLLVYEPIRIIYDTFGNPGSKEIVSSSEMIVSIISVVIFALSNQLLPFINKNLISKGKNIKNLVIGSVIGVLFIGGELFIYGDKYFPGVILGFAFLALAIMYFVLGFLLMNKLGIENVKKESSSKNSILSYLFISISLFTLAIALVFSKHNEIISTIWLFEASILYYFYSKTKEFKIYIIGLILFIIGIFNLFSLLDVVNSKEYIFLVSFSIIGASFIFNLKVLDYIKTGFERVSHDIFHIIGIGILGGLLYIIIPNTGYGWSLLGISIFVFIIGFLYSYFSSNILKVFFLICFSVLMLVHIGEFDSIIRKIDRNNLSYLRVLQYASTGILGTTILFWNKFNKLNIINNFIKGFYSLYILIIFSFYINDIFNTTFAVTIFWGIVASIFLFFGIIKDRIKYRTMGLYLLSLVLIKIFISDLWLGIDDAVSRVLALIVIGILLIIISIQYTKRYGNNLKGEFSLDNLGEK